MLRSFDQRIFSGVCGGMGQALRVNPWLLRLIWLAMTLVTTGFAALVYLALWWSLPQRLPSVTPRGGFGYLLLALVLLVGMGGLWLSRDATWLRAENSQPLFLPVTLLILSAIYLLNQVKA
ncbi:MAG: PspC domain-containing protein [Armatimonadetes bacterium]|nr:PspC domain-containing protein [Anaerolineae bacterium]